MADKRHLYLVKKYSVHRTLSMFKNEIGEELFTSPLFITWKNYLLKNSPVIMYQFFSSKFCNWPQ